MSAAVVCSISFCRKLQMAKFVNGEFFSRFFYFPLSTSEQVLSPSFDRGILFFFFRPMIFLCRVSFFITLHNKQS